MLDNATNAHTNKNVLYNSALRQSNSIKKDLAALSDATTTATPALKGQLNASLTSFSRTIEEYNGLAKQEIIAEKQQKAFGRVKGFRAELADFREEFGRLKKESDEAHASQNRNELFGRRPHHAATPENPYANESSLTAEQSPFRPTNSSVLGAAPSDMSRETHALKEQSFLASTNSQLDDFLDRGRAVLGDLGQQREMLKGTQRKLYSVANTLGISGDTIRMVERRAKQDKWIFWTGVVVFLAFCYLVLWLFR